MIDTKYWEDYYEYWDRFVKEWFKERENEKRPENEKYPIWEKYKEISEAYNNAVAKLNFDELPNPYFGDPKNGVDAVIINLNPGGSEKDKNKAGTDATQFYSNIDVGDDVSGGWLIRKFRDEANCSYKRFVGNDENANVNWSQLNPKLRGHTPEVCGVKWWQGEENGMEMWDGKERAIVKTEKKRIEWIRRIYKDGAWISPSRVFALELCPYHSEKFKIDYKQSDYLGVVLPFIKEYVIDPAVNAVAKWMLPFTVAVGSDVAKVLAAIGADCEKEWSNKKPIDVWPKKNDGRLKERKYRLYTVESSCGQKARILVTQARPATSSPREEDFKDVERVILKYIKDNPL